MTVAPESMPWNPSERELERQAIRRSLQAKRRFLASLITVAALGVLAVAIISSPGWDRVKVSFFSWEHGAAAFPDILRGFGINVAMFMIAEPLILLIGGALAIIRNTVSPWLTPLRLLAIAYVDFFRGVPTLLVVILFGFAIPGLRLAGIPNDPIFLGGAALVICYSAYVAEVIRAGIDSVHPSQIASAEALGLSRAQTTRHVVLPQAIRRVMPPLLNDFVSLQKDTSLVSTLGVFEALFVAQDYGNYTFNYTPYLVTSLFFVALTIPLARFTDYLGRRALIRERGR